MTLKKDRNIENNRYWVLPDVDHDSVGKLCEELGISKVLCSILYGRGFRTKEEIEKFFSCEYSQDWALLSDIKKGAKFLLSSIKNDAPIVIHGDYDVDGISSTSILFDFVFYELNYKNIFPYIPNRAEEGYGLSEKSLSRIFDSISRKSNLEDLTQKNLKPLVISVDCGIKDIELIDQKWSNTFDFIICDHHTMRINDKGKSMFSKKAKAVIHPLHPKSKLGFKEICGAMVTYKFIEAINSIGKFEKDVGKYIPLVSLATNCDVMPLIHENRSIVMNGLSNFGDMNLGLDSLVAICGLKGKSITTYDLGFVIGPRINASGRIGNPLDAVKLLVTKDTNLARKISLDLNRLNSTRQEITKDRMVEAEKQIEAQLNKGNKMLIIIGDNWEEGIVGLIAGKVCEKYNLPTIVFSVVEDRAVGSARSKDGFDITNALSNVSGHIEKYGGHKGAAGLSVKVENLDKFCMDLICFTNDNLTSENVTKIYIVESKIELGEINTNLLSEIEKLKPFGHGFEEPNFLLINCIVQRVFELGSTKQHLKFIVGNDEFDEGMEMLVFNADEKHKSICSGDQIRAVINIQNNFWNGVNRIQMIGRFLEKE